MDILNSDALDITLFVWKTFGKNCIFLYLRHKITTWKLKIVQGNRVFFEYKPITKTLTSSEGILDKIVGFPEERLAIEDIFQDLKSKADNTKFKISTVPYKWMSKLSTKCLLELEVNLGRRTSDGKTILHYCAKIADPLFLKCFLSKFEDVDGVDVNGKTPLHEACESENYFAAKLLLKAGSNVNAVTKSGNTALMILSDRKNHDPKFFKLLLKYNASTELENMNGMRAIDIARIQNKNSSIIMLIHPMFSQM